MRCRCQCTSGTPKHHQPTGVPLPPGTRALRGGIGGWGHRERQRMHGFSFTLTDDTCPRIKCGSIRTHDERAINASCIILVLDGEAPLLTAGGPAEVGLLVFRAGGALHPCSTLGEGLGRALLADAADHAIASVADHGCNRLFEDGVHTRQRVYGGSRRAKHEAKQVVRRACLQSAPPSSTQPACPAREAHEPYGRSGSRPNSMCPKRNTHLRLPRRPSCWQRA